MGHDDHCDGYDAALCGCLPCQWRQQRPRESGRQRCIYSGAHGLRRPGDPVPESVRIRTKDAQAIHGL